MTLPELARRMSSREFTLRMELEISDQESLSGATQIEELIWMG